MATISGTVKDASGNFCARMVRAYRRSDGAFAGECVSNATTGAYSITALDTSKHYAIVLDGGVTAGDSNWGSVVLLMEFDSALTDSSPLGVSFTNSGVTLDTAVKQVGAGSAAFASKTLSSVSDNPFSLQGSDWTVEFYVYPNALSGWQTVISKRSATWEVGFNGSNVYFFNGTVYTSSLSTVSNGVFTHVRVVQSGGNTLYFLNGELKQTIATSGSGTGSGKVYVGSVGSGQYFNGRIDSLRVTKMARSTANFTPNPSPHPLGTIISAPTENALTLDYLTPV